MRISLNILFNLLCLPYQDYKVLMTENEIILFKAHQNMKASPGFISNQIHFKSEVFLIQCRSLLGEQRRAVHGSDYVICFYRVESGHILLYSYIFFPLPITAGHCLSYKGLNWSPNNIKKYNSVFKTSRQYQSALGLLL